MAEGRAGVQDEGSQLVSLALASAPLDGPDLRWLDLCAGPGGKAALLAALASGRGAGVLANERLPHRAELVRRTLRGADGVLGVVTGDGTRPPWPAGSFDWALVDAPCTGLGALRRRAEARWRRQPADLDALVPLQQALLSAALDSVRPGGVVLYATCSPAWPRRRRSCPRCSRRGPTRRWRTRRRCRATYRTARSAAGHVPAWPHRHGTDAMFGALLSRR